MLLAIDIGNTTVSFAILQKNKVVKEYTLEQGLKMTEYLKKFAIILNAIEKKYSVANVLMCSVSPDSLKVIEKAVLRRYKDCIYVVGRDIKVPIKNKYKQPSSVGQDRLVGAYAAKILYGYPTVIIDFGTAITFDVVSRKGDYEGGIIVPGIRLSAESLFSKTALLPRIDKIKKPTALIGKTTKESILSGIFNGYGALSDGLIQSISKDVKGRPRIILTGGYTEIMSKYIKAKVYAIDQHLVFQGMRLLYENILDS